MLGHKALLGVAVSVLVFIAAATVKAAWLSTARFGIQPAKRRLHGLSDRIPYEDEDGVASKHSPLLIGSHYTKVVATFTAIAASLCGVANLAWVYFGPNQGQWTTGWFLLMAWGIALAQVLYTFAESSPIQRYNSGAWAGLSYLVLAIASSIDAYHRVTLTPNGKHIYAVYIGYSSTQVIAGLATFLLLISIPRRPQVYVGGKVVDGQFTGSAFHRYTFGWVKALLDHSRAQQRLEYDDLPALDHHTRSEDTLNHFNSTSSAKSGALWYLIYADHKARFITQWILTVIESFAYHGPSIFLFKILKNLEDRDREPNNPDAWLLVVGLGFALLFHLVIDTWVNWISFAHLSIPIRNQLSALIFQKSLRMKNVKTAPKNDDVDDKRKKKRLRAEGMVSTTPEDDTFEMESLLPDGGDSDSDNPTEQTKELPAAAKEDTPNVSQGIVNLLGVDAQRVADFTGYNNLVPGAVIKVLIAIGLLVALTGWQSVLAGLAVPLLFVPFNSMSTKRYAYYQTTVMKARDVKAKIATEALNGIRQIKFSATEIQWQDIIMTAREAELKELWSSFIWACVMLFCWFAMPIVLGGVVLGLYAWLNGGIQASVAFTALSIFGKLEWCLSVVPLTITDFYDAKVSIGRIEKHLQGLESSKSTQHGDSIRFEDASIRWPSESNDDSLFTIRDISMELPPKELSIICGKTGSGKGLLLAAMLGEADILTGRILMPYIGKSELLARQKNHSDWIIPSTVAYVSQIPWIENASIKDNILFDSPYDPTRFRKVLHACALEADLLILPDGDATEVGAKGINLSGGQRWRVTLARALYSRAEILIFDDIFSAVDAHVGRHILEHAVMGELARQRTRILATHHVGLVLPFAQYQVLLGENGQLLRAGPVRNDGVSKHFESISIPKNSEDQTLHEIGLGSPAPAEVNNPAAKTFVKEEKRERGRIKWSTYNAYIQAAGGFSFWLWTLAFFVLLPLSIYARSWLVKVWSESSSDAKDKTEKRSDPDSTLIFYLALYLGISIVSATVVSVKVILVCVGAIRASRKLFEDVTYAILRAPLRWLDTEPSGRVLNRLIGDFVMVDAKFPSDIIYTATSFLSLITIVVAAVVVSPYLLVPFTILGLVCIYNASLFLHGAREMKRLESSAKSPILDLYTSVLSGLDTIRSFGKTNVYSQRIFTRIDTFAQSSWYLLLATQWLSFRMSVAGSMFAIIVAMVVILSPSINASLAGFALSYALEYSATIIQTIRRYASVELDMNCVERIAEYMNMSTETEAGLQVNENWPWKGQISVNDLEVGYADDLPSVLKGLTFSVNAGKRIGVVGRTGSGKSSLALSLFRFLEARQGSIKIDGVDISTIQLHDLRSRISIIPQDPVLFSGTLRSNLDIFEKYGDDVLRDALRRVHLLQEDDPKSAEGSSASSSQSANAPLDLDSPVSEGGLNLSQGQRQLICLARAIVSQPKVLVLDEATSAVDMGTDELIQRSIRESFSDCTMVVIAHRLSTVADFDSVLVMEDGRSLEYGPPKELFKARAAFYSMLQESGELEKLKIILDRR